MEFDSDYKPNAVIHLFETAHSGFYGDDSSATVNLVPKTWTRYTVTDGNWMTPKTVDPLVLRDIYLANKIDEVDEYLGSLYKEGKHIIIDKETNTISVNPFDYKYNFTNGILNTDYDVYTQLPSLYGGLENRLVIKDDVLTYDFEPGTTESGYIEDQTDIETEVITGFIMTADNSVDEFPTDTKYVLVTSAIYEYDDRYSNSGGWLSGYEELYDEYEERKVRHDYIPEIPPVTGNDDLSGIYENIFNPADSRLYNATLLTGGSNYNAIIGGGDGPMRFDTMVPRNVMYIYDKD